MKKQTKKKEPSKPFSGCALCTEGWIVTDIDGKKTAVRCVCLKKAITGEGDDESVPF